MTKKLFTILLIIAVAGFATLGFFYWQMRAELLSQTQEVEDLLKQIDTLEKQIKDLKTKEEIPTDETSTWKTYRDEEYGYDIKYPENWYVDIDTHPPSFMKPLFVTISSYPSDPYLYVGKGTATEQDLEVIGKGGRVSIAILDIGNLSLRNFVENKWGRYRTSSVVTDGREGLKKVYKENELDTPTDELASWTTVEYFVLNKNNVYMISGWMGNNASIQTFSELIDRIISTFKFIE